MGDPKLRQIFMFTQGRASLSVHIHEHTGELHIRERMGWHPLSPTTETVLPREAVDAILALPVAGGKA